MASIYDLASNYEIGVPVQGLTPQTPGAALPAAELPVAEAPIAQPAQAGVLGNPALSGLLERYFPAGNEYGDELKTARAAASKEAQAFQDMIQRAMTAQEDSGPSKAEMYFRLAAAFGAPTKTGGFAETLGNVGTATTEMLKEKRTAEREAKLKNLQLGLEAQKLKMQGAKEDLSTLRTLASEGMKDKRTIATELIKEYVKSGQPQSTAGKQAMDEGLRPGTPEYQKRVSQIAEMNTEQQMSRINATLAQMSASQANLALAQQKFDFQQGQAAKLTPAEVKLKSEAEDALASVKGSMGILKRAYDLNKNSMSGSLIDKASRLALEAAGSKDPVLLNTQELENLLTDQMISSASEKLKGVLSDSDIKLLSLVSGAKSKNQEERRRIMLNAYGALQRGFEKQQKRLNEINQGLYRETTPAGGLE